MRRLLAVERGSERYGLKREVFQERRGETVNKGKYLMNRAWEILIVVRSKSHYSRAWRN